jgi:hypothetical protein
MSFAELNSLVKTPWRSDTELALALQTAELLSTNFAIGRNKAQR